MEAASKSARIVLVDDDDSFRESLGLNLIDEGYEVTSFSSGAAALGHFGAGGSADIVLLDWRMPGMNGLEVLRSLRRASNATPVIFLTVLREDIYEEAALEGGAVDFIDKSRRLSILVKRLRLIAEAARPAPESDGRPSGDVLHLGRRELRFDINRASWSGAPIDLKIIALLALCTARMSPIARSMISYMARTSSLAMGMRGIQADLTRMRSAGFRRLWSGWPRR
jgi:two-component system response regulator ChvI